MVRVARYADNLGSSPRVRGKLGGAGDVSQLRRLIPACAGKTKSKPLTSKSSSAHPRVCGENAAACGTADAKPGSSPRVRGKRQRGRR